VTGGLLCCQAGAAPLLDFSGKLSHGLLCDNTAFATRERSLSHLNGRKDFCAGALTLLP